MKKIVVIGPESTGKSTLCEQLAQKYQTLWVPEFARDYLVQHGTGYVYDDLLTIAKGQIGLEDAGAAQLQTTTGDPQAGTAPLPLFIDTDMYVMKVWCEFVFGKCHAWILDQITKRKYDLYLLCNVDLPWVKDELREYPDLATRQQLYNIYKGIMMSQAVSWVDISGNYDERLRKAIKAVDDLLAH